MTATSTKPYFIRAIYDWCNDNGYAPHIVVAVDEATRVPRAYVTDGKIVLNIGPEATQGLLIGNEELSFHARFDGAVQSVVIPIARVLAIYARENGQGMGFEVATEVPGSVPGEQGRSDGSAPDGEVSPQPTAKPRLTRIK